MESIVSTPPTAFLARPFPPLREQAIAHLHAVRDPHTDLSIVQLGMVEEVNIDGHHIVVVCRYPQAWYSTDTSLALAAQIHQRLATISGVWTIDVVMLSEGTAGRQSIPKMHSIVRPLDMPELAPA